MVDVNNELERPYISGIIDRIEGEWSIIRLADGQELRIASNKLLSGNTEGKAVRIIVSNDEEEQITRERQAKAILNEILGKDKP